MNPVVRDLAEQGVGQRKIGTVAQENDVERDFVEYLGAHYSIEPDEITDGIPLVYRCSGCGDRWDLVWSPDRT